CVVVDKSDGSETKESEQRDEHKWVRQIRPEHHRNGGGKPNEHSAQRRSTGLLLVFLLTFLTNVCSDLHLAYAATQPQSEKKCTKHCREARVNGANSDVAKHIQRAEVSPQNFVEEVVKHLSAGPPRAARPSAHEQR